MAVETKSRSVSNTYSFFRPGYASYSFSYNVAQVYLKTLKSEVRHGDRVTPLPYEHSSFHLVDARQNSGIKGFESLTGGLNHTSFSGVDYCPYIMNGGYDAPDTYVSYPLKYQDKLKVAMLKNLGSGTFDYGVSIAEMLQTASFIGETGRRIMDITGDIMRADVKRLSKRLRFSRPVKRRIARRQDTWKHTADGAADLWLESRYALRPLLIDVENARDSIGAIGPGLSTEPDVSIGKKMYEPFMGSTSTGDMDISWKGRATHRMQCSFRIKDMWEMAKTQLGFNLTHIAWEKTKLSFMVDWIVNIGDWLTSLHVFSNTSFLHGSQSVKIEGEVTFTGRNEASFNGQAYDKSSWTYAVKCYRRWVLTSWTLPMPTLQDPFEDISEAWKKGADVISLLWRPLSTSSARKSLRV